MEIQTPKYDHIYDYPTVYEPSEDTFLFIDALEKELSFIRNLNPLIIAEIGSGSGLNLTALSTVLGNNHLYVATDINIQACLATKITSKVNNVIIECFNMEFLNCFKNKFDIILFNPPYVVTETDEIKGVGIERSWAGGVNGREIMDKLFPKIPDLLTENGVFYLVVIKENNPNEICDYFKKLNFKTEFINDRKVRGEHLYVLKFQKLTSI